MVFCNLAVTVELLKKLLRLIILVKYIWLKQLSAPVKFYIYYYYYFLGREREL